MRVFGGKNYVGKKLDIRGRSKVKMNNSNHQNEALCLIRDRRSASMALISCYLVQQFWRKYIRENTEYL